jgi:signal transduction histidine kinase
MLNCILFASGLMLAQRNDQVVLTAPYNFIFGPYFVLSIISIIYLILHNRKLSKGFDKRTFTFHIVGFGVLLIGGLVDFLNLSLMNSYMFLHIPSFSIFGVIGFGIITVYAFTERLIFLINEHTKLNLAYVDLEKACSLISVGKSTAILNHEMRNSLFSVLFHTEKILEESATKNNHVLCRQIITTVNNLLNLNHELLDMSKKRIMESEGSSSVDLVKMVKTVIETFFAEKKNCFHFLDFPDKQIIYCDKDRMNDVIKRLLNYSVSKGSTAINLRLYKDICAVLFIIDDDIKDVVEYCEDGNNAEFIPANNKEKREISMMRSTIEANGGHLNIFVKKCFKPPSDGLVYNIALPNYAEAPFKYDKDKDRVVLIKNGLSNLEPIIKIFNNVFVNPHIVQSFKDVINKYDDSYIILGGEEELFSYQRQKSDLQFFVISSDGDGRVIVKTSFGAELGILSEHLILCDLLKLNRV